MSNPLRKFAKSSQCRIGAILWLCGALGAPLSYAGDFSHYRGLQFGMSLSAAAKAAGTNSIAATLLYTRPALIQEMEWQPLRSDLSTTDPVKQGLLCFFNGELFRIVVTYDRDKIDGMTADDMIEGISAIYGAASKPVVEIPFHSNYAEAAKVLARWQDTEYSYNLVRTGDESSFAMVLYSKRLDALAQAAIVESVRLDLREAPEREIARQKDQAEAERVLLEKSRSVNKPNFRP